MGFAAQRTLFTAARRPRKVTAPARRGHFPATPGHSPATPRLLSGPLPAAEITS
jgi:hypothetical protein